MSWTFHLQNINRSFERIAAWYSEFVSRTEVCFQNMHARIMRLEEHQTWKAPSDEQLERVLRKILAEKFANDGLPPGSPTTVHQDQLFVRDLKDLPYSASTPIDPATLVVEPDSVPSKCYADTLKMLEGGLACYPLLDRTHLESNDIKDIKITIDQRDPRLSNSV